MRRSFDHLAAPYQILERLCFLNALQAARVAWLPRLEGLDRVLVLGEGDGRFLEALLTRGGVNHVDCIEGSPGMVKKAELRLSNLTGSGHGSVTFRIGDARRVELEHEGYDAVVTCFFLDCFQGTELKRMVARIAASLRPEGYWIVADFAPPRDFRSRFWLRMLYGAFRAVTDIQATALDDPRPLLKAQGLEVQQTQRFARDLIYSSLLRKRPGEVVGVVDASR